eukprot:CAMPEP_0179939474 /NCGR_PEP_ID=MMETSP0983-20121128/15670_1 /TAXON_ID=483367 /ORGANISM="non described non described, Strain CCMP 2436" /LENGTH=48 /DNA_ID= /DNA_START= /DNA_END= /DNA_ORIENTATION=
MTSSTTHQRPPMPPPVCSSAAAVLQPSGRDQHGLSAGAGGGLGGRACQ